MTAIKPPHFTRLTIAGFKSFADEVTIEILPGLTGIIGPNGCGKSNIVDALRWVMGESSARALRGGDSDDLIFAGTNARSARNLAQVSVQIDDAKGLAQPPFQNCTELVISRQAERGSNSTYRLNNTVVRARDIQMLFADMDSGARSSAIISQNRVSQIIEVKPEERRVLLEEAAGIKGLYVRRKDAEIKLKQAQTNLDQAQLNLDALHNRIALLSEQSEQARTYRALSESIRKTEKALLFFRHNQAHIRVTNARKELTEAQEALAKAALLLHEKKTIFENLQHEESAQKEHIEHLRPRLSDQKLQMEIAQNNLSHLQNSWNERAGQLNDLKTALNEKNTQLDALLKQEREYSDSVTLLKKEIDPSLDLSSEKQKIEREEKALDDTKSAYDTAREEYHQASFRYETAKNKCDDIRQRLEQGQASLTQLASELEKTEQKCADSSLITEAEEQVRVAGFNVTKAEQDKTASSTLCQEQKIVVEKAKSALEADLQRQKHLSSQGDLISERLKTLENRKQKTLSEQKSLESSVISPEKIEEQKQSLSEARALYEQALSKEKATNDAKEKQEEIWLKVRTHQKEKIQKKTLLEREIERLNHLQQTTAQHLAHAHKALLEASSEKESYKELEETRTKLADQQKLYDAVSQEFHSSQALLKTSLNKLNNTRKELHQHESELLQIKSEATGLERSLEIPSEDNSISLLTSLEVDADYAHALAVALNEGLNAVVISHEPPEKTLSYKRAWRDLPPEAHPSSPLEGLRTLADFVKAPPALSRALNAIFVLEDTSQAPALQALLPSGTSLISQDGSLWRWDGYIQSSAVELSETRKLQSLQRLRDLQSRATLLEETTGTVRSLLENEQNESKALQDKIEEQRGESTQLEHALSHLRFQIKEREHGLELAEKKLQYAQTQLDKHIAGEAEIKTNIAELKNTLDELTHEPDESQAEEQKTLALREAAIEAQTLRAERHRNFSTIERHYTQIQLQSENIQSRLKDIDGALKLIDADFQTLSEQKKTFEIELTHLNVAEHQKNLAEQQKKLEEKLSISAQLETDYLAFRGESERARNKLNILTQEQSASLARRDTLQQQVRAQKEICLSLEKDLKQALDVLEDMPSLEESVGILETRQIKFEKDRLSFQENRVRYETLEQKTRTVTGELQTLSLKLQTLENDKTRLSHEVHELQQKKQLCELALQSQENPAQLSQQVEALKSAYETLKNRYDENDQKLSALSDTFEASRNELSSLQEQHALLREKTSGLTERLTQAQNQYEQLKLQEPLPSPPDNDSLSENKLSGKNEASLRREINKLQQERDQLGTVNLKAQADHEAATKEAEELLKELSEITEAIDKQQKIVTTINREGRARLSAVFADVDQHFQTLFSRIFGGGKAHLAMIGSDDPLEAGLEIYAQPPGKKLSTLSLLSGGEQALTALSLIFAAFFCNPAPICVLDEIDAPLDEANVEQFCRLIIDINKQTETRFLVVTHHQVTMAHMNQLYGITMQERGVSRALSVSLSESSKFIGS